jgi:uncharacterized protein (DUF2141 family)
MPRAPLHPPRRSKSIAWSLALALGLGGAARAAAADPAGALGEASLTVTFQGLKTSSGAVMMSLSASPEAYADKAPPVATAAIPVTGPSATTVFKDLGPGVYAIKAFHDLNGDGKLNTNPFGIPTEPYAFSNNARGAMGPPSWAAASFEIKAGETGQTIDID